MDYIKRNKKLLRDFYQGNNGDQVVKALLELKDKGEKFGVRSSLSRVENAIRDVAG